MRKKILILLFLLILIIGNMPNAVFAQFVDLSKPIDHWSYDTVIWSTEKGIIKGYDDNTFRPDNLITEAEFLVTLLRAFPNSGADKIRGGGQHWADGYYELAHEAGLPLYDGAFRNEPIKRGQVALIIAATLGNNFPLEESVMFLYDEGISSGMSGEKTFEDFYVNNNLTRAEAVQFIRNIHRKYNGNPKFIGVETITGKNQAKFNEIRLMVLGRGYQLSQVDEHRFNIIKTSAEVRPETILNFSAAQRESEFSNVLLNRVDLETISLAKEILNILGVPATDELAENLNYVVLTGETIRNTYFGDYRLEYIGEKERERATVRFKHRDK